MTLRPRVLRAGVSCFRLRSRRVDGDGGLRRISRVGAPSGGGRYQSACGRQSEHTGLEATVRPYPPIILPTLWQRQQLRNAAFNSVAS